MPERENQETELPDTEPQQGMTSLIRPTLKIIEMYANKIFFLIWKKIWSARILYM